MLVMVSYYYSEDFHKSRQTVLWLDQLPSNNQSTKKFLHLPPNIPAVKVNRVSHNIGFEGQHYHSS
jgi:hypothetical protein